MTRRILIVANPNRPETLQAADVARAELERRGIAVCADTGEGAVDAVMVFGGDGTMLRAAREVQGTGAPLLGVNMGHVGFLAELERGDVAHAVTCLADGEFDVEERRTVEVVVRQPDGTVENGWALNEVAIERSELLRTLDVAVEVDGRPLASFGCDGIVIATPTGSTAHAFSGGGPVVWPDVEALLMVPLAAHALFARPLVVGPRSKFAVEVLDRSPADGLLVLDGAETIAVRRGARIEVRLGAERVRLARTSDAPFTDRLVRKFGLDTEGWRGANRTPKE
ncbi:NAD kinase [Demequina sp. TTPB684]|uniref:NAD kinase n=1 Tax=unclassified Demequina TaxID=2620311 RepID=UPI001CF33505|nr:MULTISPECIES: NAD kinase [unclassified Demequina]MCB2413873.1 NAD kinase [Demequina sp. TTPB684]UPU89439.1 NAD kinase [Demequina sp. TMPB413]